MLKKYFSGLSRDTFLLTFTSLFADIATEMLYPILPIFLTQYLGDGGAIVGIIEGVATAMQNVVQGVSGAVSDKIQKRKTVAIVGYLIAAVSKPFIGLSATWTQVLVARSSDRLGTGIRSAPRDGLIANSVENNNRGRAFGLEGIGDNIGAFFGPLIAIALLYYFNVGIRSIFYLSIIPGLLAVVAVLMVKEKAGNFTSKSKLDINVFKFPKSYWKYLAVIAVFGIGNISSSFMILETKNIGVPLIGTILIYAFYNLAAALISYPAGVWADKFGRKYVLLTSFLLFLVSLIGFALTHNFWIITISFLLFGVYMGIFRTSGKAFASDFSPKELQASAVGWFNTVVGLSGLAASIIAGQIYDKVGHSAVFAVAAVFVFLGAMFLLFLRPQKIDIT